MYFLPNFKGWLYLESIPIVLFIHMPTIYTYAHNGQLIYEDNKTGATLFHKTTTMESTEQHMSKP